MLLLAWSASTHLPVLTPEETIIIINTLNTIDNGLESIDLYNCVLEKRLSRNKKTTMKSGEKTFWWKTN